MKGQKRKVPTKRGRLRTQAKRASPREDVELAHPPGGAVTDFERLAQRLRFPPKQAQQRISAQARKLLRAQARTGFVEGNVMPLLMSLSHAEALHIVTLNIDALRDRGIYESALFQAWTIGSTNWSSWRLEFLCTLFDIADRARLLAAGDPMPEGERFTLYRGVAGVEPRRKEAGLAWTRDPDKARVFAKRGAWLGYPDPAVYTTEAARGDVYFYSADRREEEFVFRAARWDKYELVQ